VVWRRPFDKREPVVDPESFEGRFADSSDLIGCWGPCYTMSSHAALGVVRAGVAVLKGEKGNISRLEARGGIDISESGSGVRINCISPGQIDIGVDLNNFDMRGMTSQLPPANLQSKEVLRYNYEFLIL